MNLKDFNALPEQAQTTQLETCCVSKNWITGMIQAIPFTSEQQMFKVAEDVWAKLTESDYLEAFEGHPRIGDVSTLKKKFASTAATAGHEQSGMNAANDALLQRMKQQNDAYVDKFGFIFIVCASGKSATEMLALLEARLDNNRETEVAIAATEQAKITAIRLGKLLG